MARDYTLEVRRAVVSHLIAGVTLVPAGRIFGEYTTAAPAWPFIRYSSNTLPWEATCYDGSQVNADIHVFANGPSTDQAANIAAEVVRVMETLPAGEVQWLGNIGPLRDDAGPDKWHIVVQFRVIWT